MEESTTIQQMLYDIQWVHPEQQDGEILLINLHPYEQWQCPSFMEYIRRGEVAYRTYGKGIVPGMQPLFGKLKKT